MVAAERSDRSAPIQVFTAAFPKGGGAIQGLGESTTIGDFTGTVGLSIPLSGPALRLGPGLSLVYGSGQGNGPFGLGMSLSLPAITRLTAKGVPRYDADDTMAFAGNELVPDAGAPRDTVDARISRYHLRTEGSFAWIEHHEPKASDGLPDPASAYWVVHDADGARHVFGKSDAARVRDSADERRVGEWWLEETVNAIGEHVHYTYKREPGDSACTHRAYLKHVRFGNECADQALWSLSGVDPSAERWMFELVFDYGEHAQDASQGPAYEPTLDWTPREDAFSRFDLGFEVRCQRLCRRVLLFHGFAALGEAPVVISEMNFAYAASPYLTRLIEVRSSGYRHDEGVLKCEALPPLAFDYTAFSLSNGSFRPLEHMDFVLDESRYQVVDLYGEGIPGILYNDRQSYLYRRAERVERSPDGLNVTYAATAIPLSMPAGGLAPSALIDLTGDGTLDAVHSEAGSAGFFSRSSEDGWQQFVPFSAFPIEFLHAHAQLADLSGDGLPDLVLIGPRSVRLFPSRGRRGFDAAMEVLHAGTEDLPIPPGGGQTLTAFADVLGSGQQHLVRVRHNEVTCWPNLGLGRFGEARRLPIRMHAGLTAENFDPSRLFLADLDGSGAADLIYVGDEVFHIYLNRCGNGFDDAWSLALPAGFRYDQLDDVSVADLYGNGTSALILSRLHMESEHWVFDATRAIKPYLLERINDNMGAEMRFAYTSSSHEWLDERLEDTNARCRLPFPIHVVQKVEQHDEISDNTLTHVTRYRRGYYDGEERQFRGFGLVLREDMESSVAAMELDAAGKPYTAPAQTRTWYHTGAPDGDRISGAYQGDPRAATLGPPRFETQAGAESTNSVAIMQRALSGHVLREEVYGLDGESAPYSVTSYRYCVRELQTQGPRDHPVLLPYELEELSYLYEREPEDPQCQHAVTMAVDPYGVVTRALRLSYPRRPALTGADPDYRDSQQEALHVLDTRLEVCHLTTPASKGWRLRLPVETVNEALTGVSPPARGVYDYEALSASDGPLSGASAVLAGQQRHFYADPVSGSELPLGVATIEGLACRVRVLDMTRAELHAAFAELQPPPDVDFAGLEALLVTKGGFELIDDRFWNPGVLASFSTAQTFFAVRSHTDAFGARTTYSYDDTSLFVTATVDAFDNRVAIKYDYQALAPVEIVDINDNVSEVRYDALGRVRLRSHRGTEPGFDDGIVRASGFGELARYSSTIEDLAGALQDPAGAIDNAAGAYFYEAGSWMGTLRRDQLAAAGIPSDTLESVWRELVAHRLVTEEGGVQARLRRLADKDALRERLGPHDRAVLVALRAVTRTPPHNAELLADRYITDPNPGEMQVRISLNYSDGFGRVLQTKIKAEGGDSYIIDANGALVVDAEGQPVVRDSAVRWLTSGCVVYNHKGHGPVRLRLSLLRTLAGPMDQPGSGGQCRWAQPVLHGQKQSRHLF